MLSPPHLLLSQPRPPGLVEYLLLRLEQNGRVASPETDKLAHLAALLLKGQLGAPGDGAGVLVRPGVGGPLVVKVRQGLELVVGEEPELEDRRGEGRVDGPRGELDEGCQGELHLRQLALEARVLGQPSLAQGLAVPRGDLASHHGDWS